MILAISDTMPQMKLFPDSVSTVGWYVLYIFGLSFLIFAAITWYRYYKQERLANLPNVIGNADSLFEEASNILKLTFSERKLIKKIAKEMKLAQPTSILLSPTLLVISAEFWEKHHNRFLTKQWGLDKLDSIANQIYGRPLRKLRTDLRLLSETSYEDLIEIIE